jgi:xanthine dehydrogenase small subunit
MRETITFVLNNRVETVSGLRGDTTLLNWLRQTKRLTGSKEGCAEGDCGACTVAVLRPGDARWHPVNACILFLGMLEGASVTTVEGIAPPDGSLHPCQQVMVDYHGSQCGFCTPGFVMSLFAAWCNGDGLSPASIDTTLAGNLCRCTGYRPIADAASALRQGSVPPAFEAARRKREAQLMKYIAHKDTVMLSDGHCRFVAPATVADFTQLYAETPDATIVSGATDVGLWVTKGQAKLPMMLWTGRVHGFDSMKKAGAHWHIGPAVTHAMAMDRLAKGRPDLGEVMRRFGSVQVRASGTVCGNIANGSPIGDLPPMLIALAAEVELTAPDSNRLLALEDFFIDYGKQDRATNEYVSGLRVPSGTAPHFRAYKISKRFDQDISAVMLAANLEIIDGMMVGVRLAFGGMAGIPKRASHAEAVLTGKPLDITHFKKAGALLADDFTPLSDMRGSAKYRLLTAQNLLVKYGLELISGKQMRLAGQGLAASLDGW